MDWYDEYLRSAVCQYLQDAYPDSMLLQLWRSSYWESHTLVLPAEAATALAESHPLGYHSGLWHLATQYEQLAAMALLTNSNRSAHGYEQPKSFSAWPRAHNRDVYGKATRFRRGLNANVECIATGDRRAYINLVQMWHQSTGYISQVAGDTRLDRHQLGQLCTAIALQESGGDGLNQMIR